MELDITALLAVSDDESPDLAKLMEAIEAASSQDRTVWLTERGQRIAALVPVDVAEYHEEMIRKVLSTPVKPTFFKPAVQFPQVTVQLSGHDGGVGTIIARTSEAMRAAGLDDRTVRNFCEAVMGCASYNEVLGFVAHTVNVK
jgi:hypothetical protein